jgi:sporulation protein YlmC with PRC-barrel domain
MKPTDPLKLVAELLDLPIEDKDGRYCGIVDDVELAGSAGKEMRIKALLVGPGAYDRRLPSWAFWLARKVGGDRIARVPVDQIDAIRSTVKLKCCAEDVKLHIVENKVRAWIPQGGAM